jgi:hypothetical protein
MQDVCESPPAPETGLEGSGFLRRGMGLIPSPMYLDVKVVWELG